MLQYNDRITSLTASKEIGEDYTRWKNMEGIRRMARSRLTRRRLTGRKRGGRILKELVEVYKEVLTSADKEEVDKEETKRKDMDSIMEGMRRF